MYKRAEDSKISLEVQIINITCIKADDIFKRKFPQTPFEAKQITWFQIFLLRPQQSLGL